MAAASLLSFAGLPRAGTASPNRTQTQQEESPNSSAVAARGIKLMLKDGTYQLVREYKIDGDRVRYYSLDRSDWEEIPASLVDWDQTKKVEADKNQQDAALLKKAQRQYNESRVMPLSIDASLEVARGVFLPPGEGLWVFNNKAVLQLSPAEPVYKTNKGREVEKILSPVPIISSRHTVLIAGRHAKLRVETSQPEFYMRTPPTTVPELELVQADVDRGERKIARIDALFKSENASSAHVLSLQRWEIAKNVYRFTLGQNLRPGEYALVEVIPADTQLDQLSLSVWDFGVDASSGETAKGK